MRTATGRSRAPEQLCVFSSASRRFQKRNPGVRDEAREPTASTEIRQQSKRSASRYLGAAQRLEQIFRKPLASYHSGSAP